MQPEKTKKARGKRRNTAYHCFSALPYITTPACLLQHASSPHRDHTVLCNPTQISLHNLPIKHGHGCHRRNATNNNFFISLFGETEDSVFQEEGLQIEGSEWECRKSSLLAGPDGICTFLQFPLWNSTAEFQFPLQNSSFHYGIPVSTTEFHCFHCRIDVSTTEFHCFHCRIPVSTTEFCAIDQTWSNELKEAERAVLLLAAGSIIKYLWNQDVRGERCVAVLWILPNSAQIPRGPGCADVCSRKYERVFVCVCMQWLFRSNSRLLVLHLSDSETWTWCKRSSFWGTRPRPMGRSLPVTFHPRGAGERGKDSGVWLEQHAATANSCLDTSQVFLHFPPFHFSLCLQRCTCPFKSIRAVRGGACECVYGTLQTYSDLHQFTFLVF